MIITTRRLVSIDDEAIVSDMLDAWQNGQRNAIVETLKCDHPGLAVFFMVEGIRRKIIRESDANYITNMLIDDRKALLDETEAV